MAILADCHHGAFPGNNSIWLRIEVWRQFVYSALLHQNVIADLEGYWLGMAASVGVRLGSKHGLAVEGVGGVDV